jgi:hypothetical protein
MRYLLRLKKAVFRFNRSHIQNIGYAKGRLNLKYRKFQYRKDKLKDKSSQKIYPVQQEKGTFSEYCKVKYIEYNDTDADF